MYILGEEEVEAVASVIRSGKLFRYNEGNQCARFEERWGEFVGRPYVRLCSSGTTALIGALTSLGIGPGDEVIVPAHTYMATALAVLACGAIPVIADIDESVTLCPRSLEQNIGPRTRAVIPVHMWGLVCDMDQILEISRRHGLLVIEDACQCVGGVYKGVTIGALGDSAAFSFNYFKNITCGEGGAIVSKDSITHQKASCLVDSCGFFWRGEETSIRPFAAGSARASEIQGAMLNAQFDRLPGMLNAMRSHKKRIVKETRDLPFNAAPSHDPDGECGTHVVYNLPDAESARAFAEAVGGIVSGRTGRHTANEWTPVLEKAGHLHPAMDPFRRAENAECRKDYSEAVFQKSLDILNRTVLIKMHPSRTDEQVSELIGKIINAAAAVV